MPRVTCHMSVSLDGFVAGPDQTRDDPVGRGGMALHQWHQEADQPGRDVDIAGGASTVQPVEVAHSPHATHVRYRHAQRP